MSDRNALLRQGVLTKILATDTNPPCCPGIVNNEELGYSRVIIFPPFRPWYLCADASRCASRLDGYELEPAGLLTCLAGCGWLCGWLESPCRTCSFRRPLLPAGSPNSSQVSRSTANADPTTCGHLEATHGTIPRTRNMHHFVSSQPGPNVTYGKL